MSILGQEKDDAERVALRCPQCASANQPQAKFCARCGVSLWETCLRCGDLRPAAESYCAVCGASRSEVTANRQEQLETDLRKAAELHAAYDFDQALALLSSIATLDHPQLAELAVRAGRLLREMAAERDRREAEARINGQRAQACFDACDFDGAAEVLAGIPLPLRSAAATELDVRVAARRQEIAALTAELHAALRQKRIRDVASTVGRLLALKPDHACGGKLAEELEQRLVHAAEKEVAAFRHDKAFDLLEQIPSRVRTPRAEELRRQVAELAWLAWDLRKAPILDATLVSTAKRLRQLVPGDPQLIKLCTELQRRTGLAEGRGRQDPLPWARQPQPTALGVAVEGMTQFRHLGRVETPEPSRPLQQAARFAVACGLALTGLGEAALPINLLSSEEQGVLYRVGRLVRCLRDQPAWGLDLGSSGLKAVQLAWDEGRQQAVIKTAILIQHAKPLSHAANETEERKLVEETLDAFLDGHETKGAQVCVSMPTQRSLNVPLELPPVDLARASKYIQFEASHAFPLPLDQLTWDCQPFDPLPTGSSGAAEAESETSHRALLVGAKRTETQRFLKPFEELDLRVDVLQSDAVALHNFLVHEYFAEDDEKASPPASAMAAIDVGCDVTNLVVSSPYSFWVRSCGVAGQTFTRALVRDLKLGIAQAEQQKLAIESAGRLGDLYEAWSSVFQDLLRDLRASLAMYAEAVPDRPVRQILGLGGGFALHGLLRCLWFGR
jgi:Tfp pilus assembly PilM family ATPase